jgi:HAD superfamily hydrolase (TIGR01509 family)
MSYAVTLDFHNTLARCDSWFALEVRGLLPEFLDWHAGETGRKIAPETRELAASTYREIRRSVMESGYELTAEACVATGLERLGLHATESEIERGVERLMRSTLHDLAPIPSALKLVDDLRSAGVLLGIVSSAVYHPFLDWSLDEFGLTDSFASVVTSASAGFYKSRTEIYAHALTRLGVDASRAVHVGDSWRWDAGTAKRAGMKTVWLNAKYAEAEVTPDLEIRSLDGAALAILALLGIPPVTAP